MQVLVTGAAGQLGSIVCQELERLGHRVLATDLREASVDARFQQADLREPAVAYSLLEDVEALVHLGNIPSLSAGASPQVVLADNVAMNANVFQAARELGVAHVVFASSLQAMVRLDDGRPSKPPYTLPYFPLDGNAPANPGRNYYALSKEMGERMLRLLSEEQPGMRCTALRFPMLAGAWLHEWRERALSPSEVNFGEALTYLELADAAALVGAVLQQQGAGYHQYFPARALQLEGYDVPTTVTRFFPRTPLRQPLETLATLVDLSALEQDLAFSPRGPLTVRLREL